MESMVRTPGLGQYASAAQPPDVDVTPIMNMFVILIPFLVSMAVFTHLAVVRFSVPPNVGASLDQPGTKPTLKMTVVVANQYLAITHGDQMLDSIGVRNGRYDFAALAEKLAVRGPRLAMQDQAIVAVQDGVAFKHVVAVMDRCREAGFVHIGLSSATDDPRKGV
jgi:biopolymer transport protein ExbD